MNGIAASAIACVFLVASSAAAAAQLRADHPLLGTWKFAVPGSSCVETLTVTRSGRIDVVSGAQIGKSDSEIADRADERGFFKWVDKTIEDNGKADCGGSITPIGDLATTYIHLDESGGSFLQCFSESLSDCFGPYVRQRAAGE